MSYPTNIKLIAIVVGIGYLCLNSNLLKVLGDAIMIGLITYGLLFYTIEAVKIVRGSGSLKSKLGDTLCLPILHTEPLALLIASVPSFYLSYRNADPNPGSRIALMGMLLCYFFTIFLLANLFLNIFKYWNTHRLYNDPVKTWGLGEKVYPLLADHVVRVSVLLSIPPVLITFTGIFIREQAFSVHAVTKYPDIIATYIVFPFALWLLLRLMREFKPPLSINFPRLVVLSLKDLKRALKVKTLTQFREVVEKRMEMFQIWQKIHRFPPRIHREMAINYLYLNNYDFAIHHFKSYLEGFNPKKLKTDRQLEMVPFLATGVNKVLFKKYRSFYRPPIQALDENFGHLEYLRPMKALENIEEAKKGKVSTEMDFVYSLFFEMLCERFKGYRRLLPNKQAEEFTEELIASKNSLQWRATIRSLLAHPEEYQRENLGESFNVVFEISNKDYFKDAFVLKGQRDRESLEKERRNTEDLREVVKDFKAFLTPVPLHITEETIDYKDEKIYVYAMRRSRGISVLEFIHVNGETDILRNVAKYLAIIHTHMPATGFKTDYRAKVLNKFNGMVVGSGITQLIVDSMAPVVESLKNGFLVFGKDAHPGNWLATENGEIVALDIEDKGAVPLEIDLVNLLEFDDFGLDRPQREEVKRNTISEYIDYYKQYSRDTVKEPFSRLRYLNAVIQRMLCLYTFWSSSSRDPSGVKRNFVLDNAIYAINEISRGFNDYYSSYQQDYKNLETVISYLLPRQD